MNATVVDLNVEVIGQRLRQLRELRGLSVSQVAKEAGVAKSYLAKLERGEVPNPGVTTLARIAAVLEVTLPQLLAQPTMSHSRPRWSAVVDPLEIERLKQTMSSSLVEFLRTLEHEEGSAVPADVVRTLALIQVRGKRPDTAQSWRFVYEAIRRSVR